MVPQLVKHPLRTTIIKDHTIVLKAIRNIHVTPSLHLPLFFQADHFGLFMPLPTENMNFRFRQKKGYLA